MTAGHVPVMLDEVLELLDPQPGDCAVDATAGRGGHAQELARRVGPAGRVVLVDRDPSNLAYAAARCRDAAPDTPIETWHESFVRVPARLAEAGWRADALLADLGFSSNQMDDPARGFSLRADGPLDMRLDPSSGVTAAAYLATISEARAGGCDLPVRRGSTRAKDRTKSCRRTRSAADRQYGRACTTGH